MLELMQGGFIGLFLGLWEDFKRMYSHKVACGKL